VRSVPGHPNLRLHESFGGSILGMQLGQLFALNKIALVKLIKATPGLAGKLGISVTVRMRDAYGMPELQNRRAASARGGSAAKADGTRRGGSGPQGGGKKQKGGGKKREGGEKKREGGEKKKEGGEKEGGGQQTAQPLAFPPVGHQSLVTRPCREGGGQFYVLLATVRNITKNGSIVVTHEHEDGALRGQPGGQKKFGLGEWHAAQYQQPGGGGGGSRGRGSGARRSGRSRRRGRRKGGSRTQ
jgi:hypothetical protein